ncbi:MAG: metallopeptidase TldD-related protein [Phycisphaerae bacterium]|nr:metallopeptidase TldD-related protein [Phycisphaerae bacterium]
MKPTRRMPIRCLILVLPLLASASLRGAEASDDTLRHSEAMMKALVLELERSMKIRMEDLEKPYFISLLAEDNISYQMSASYGALTSVQRDRSRDLYTSVRVGSYQLDNTNFAEGGGGFFRGGGGGFGGRASLPLDDDPIAIRQAIWAAIDDDYKSSVETLTKKRAYMEDKKLEDRPDDFAPAKPTAAREESAALRFDRSEWETNLRRLSAEFRKFEEIQDSSVDLLVGAGNEYLVTSEGTRLVTADHGVLLTINAETQADDGMRLADARTYAGRTVSDLPSVDALLADIDALAKQLLEMRRAPILDDYSGPVLFDAAAAAQLFRQMLAGGLVGRVDPVGTQRRVFEGAENLEKKLGQRILPKAFRVFDDPTVAEFGGKPLFGHYTYDDEGIPAQKVNLVENGVLKMQLLSRTPTKKLKGSNGHGRRAPGSTATEAAVGCLFVESSEGLSDEALKQRLIEEVKSADMEYGIRVASLRSAGLGSRPSDIRALITRMRRGRTGGLSDPIAVFRVYAADGREEPVRGCEFGPIEVKVLRDIAAAGKTPTVHNYVAVGFGGAAPPSTIVCPAVLFEELDLSKIEQELDELPLLKPPGQRERKSSAKGGG